LKCQILQKKGINPDWILIGQGAKFLHPMDCEETSKISLGIHKEKMTPKECSLEDLIIEAIHKVKVIYENKKIQKVRH